jgi:hypothetical protein
MLESMQTKPQRTQRNAEEKKDYHGGVETRRNQNLKSENAEKLWRKRRAEENRMRILAERILRGMART